MKKTEYRIITVPADDLEAEVNKAAADKWQPVTMSAAIIDEVTKVSIILERPKEA